MSLNFFADDDNFYEGMIVAENVISVNSEHNVIPKTIQMSRLTNGEAEVGPHKKTEQVPCQGFNGRCGNLGHGGTSARVCCGDKNLAGTSSNLSENINSSSQPDVVCVSGLIDMSMTFFFLKKIEHS